MHQPPGYLQRDGREPFSTTATADDVLLSATSTIHPPNNTRQPRQPPHQTEWSHQTASSASQSHNGSTAPQPDNSASTAPVALYISLPPTTDVLALTQSTVLDRTVRPNRRSSLVQVAPERLRSRRTHHVHRLDPRHFQRVGHVDHQQH